MAKMDKIKFLSDIEVKGKTLATEEYVTEKLSDVSGIQNLKDGKGTNSIQLVSGQAEGYGAVAFGTSAYAGGTYYTQDTLKIGSVVTKIGIFSNLILQGECRVSPSLEVRFSDGSYYVYYESYSYYCDKNGDRIFGTLYSESNYEEEREIGPVTVVSMQLTGIVEQDYNHGQPFLDKEVSLFDFISLYGPDSKTGAAKGDYSFTAGIGTEATIKGQTVIGTFNRTDDDALFIIGNGTEDQKSNALIVTSKGKIKTGNGETYATESYVQDNLMNINTKTYVPTPTTSNNGQILGVVDGRLEYIDMPAATNLPNVTEASF